MKLYEFQGKALFRRFGIATPDGVLHRKGDVLTGDRPCVLKAQTLSGGRGKAGAVVLCETEADRGAALEKILSMTLKGEPVNAALEEERVEIEKEFYISIAFDGEAGVPLIIASASGGTDIEEVADKHPEKILKLPFDSLIGPLDYHLSRVVKFLSTKRTKELTGLLKKLYIAYRDLNAALVEINPLAETPNGFVALDAKVELDDDAESLHSELFDALRKERSEITGRTVIAQRDTITYVPLDGDIGLISDGAGTGMLTLDMIRDHGGYAADFCEMGGLTNPEIMYSALERVSASEKPLRSLLVVLIGGFNRMDEMAEGIVKFVSERAFTKIPLVVRLCGTMEEEGKKIMRDAGLSVYDDLDDAVGAAVVGGGL
ncbi:succinate--CoA ligase [ADP-forming] subunit beta [Synergistales bacterium]|nr:succinate--CoA ligase [ADP-forming] subunit beta [Synergistales bacterium]